MQLSAEQGQTQPGFFFRIHQCHNDVTLFQLGFPSGDHHSAGSQNGDEVTFLWQIDLADQAARCGSGCVQRVFQYLKSARLETKQGLYPNSWKLALDDLLDDWGRANGRV